MAAAPSMAGNDAQLRGTGANFCLFWPLGGVVTPWGSRGDLLGCLEAGLQGAMEALSYAGEERCDQLLCSLRRSRLRDVRTILAYTFDEPEVILTYTATQVLKALWGQEHKLVMYA